MADDGQFDLLMDAAANVWAWVGPGYPDLDDPDERDRFMRDVSRVAAIYHSILCERARVAGWRAVRRHGEALERLAD